MLLGAHLAAKRPLVDLALVCAAEGQAVVLELAHRLWRLATHVLNGILRDTKALFRLASNGYTTKAH